VTTDRTLTLAYDEDAGQVVLEGLPPGPAGEAALSLAEGIELLFDCADGRLSRVLIEAGEPGGPAVIGKPAMAAVVRLFGPRACTAIRQAPSRGGDPVTLRADTNALATMSRLARLQAARVTRRTADSPLWAVEAAQLALRAGLDAHVKAETRRAVAALESADDASFSMLAAAADAVADLVQATQPKLAQRLREHVTVPGPGGSPAAHHLRGRSRTLPDIRVESDQYGRKGQDLHWWLDPRLIPAGVFRHALWPAAELTVRTEENAIVVEATLAPEADSRKLDGCVARLVDPGNRRVVGTAPFRRQGDYRVQAEIREPVPPGDAWVEVVDDETRPVLSGRLRHSRRAIRWADAALSARRQVSGLADAEWIRVAATAWGRCAQDWSSAGDPDRAYLASVRRAAICPGAVIPEEPSAWAKELADRPLLREEPFLAERADY
jgi:hypothetical protein